METTSYSYETSKNDPRKKDLRNLIIGILAVGLVASAGYALISGNNHQQVYQQDQTQIAKLSDEKGQVQHNFDDALARLDSLSGFNNKLQSMMTDRQKDIAKLKKQIRSILNKEHLTIAEKKKADELIAELNDKISEMEEQVAKLTEANQGLTQANSQLTQDNSKLTSDLQTTTTVKDSLAREADIASTLFANHISVVAIQDKKNGREKETSKAKKADKLQVSFDVLNRIVANGQTDLYVAITGPDGKMISDSSMGSGSFISREEGEKQFTTKVPVEIEAGKAKTVTFSWKQPNGFQKGTYKIEIYHNGYKIGVGTKELKKGGLFS
jgi:cell division protein FtsB